MLCWDVGKKKTTTTSSCTLIYGWLCQSIFLEKQRKKGKRQESIIFFRCYKSNRKRMNNDTCRLSWWSLPTPSSRSPSSLESSRSKLSLESPSPSDCKTKKGKRKRNELASQVLVVQIHQRAHYQQTLKQSNWESKKRATKYMKENNNNKPKKKLQRRRTSIIKKERNAKKKGRQISLHTQHVIIKRWGMVRWVLFGRVPCQQTF